MTSTALFEEYPLALAARVASLFDLQSPVEAYDFAEKGNINSHTFEIHAGRAGTERDLLLQRINHQVFTRPISVMAAMMACIDAQVEQAARRKGDLDWEAICLVPTRAGAPYLRLVDRRGSSVWRLMVKIPDCRTYKSLSEVADHAERLRVAEEAGRGLAIYGDLTAGIDASRLESPLPGYRDTRNYYSQLKSVLHGSATLEDAAQFLPEDEVLRESTQQHFLLHLPPERYRQRMNDPDLQRFIELAVGEEPFAMTLQRELEAGRIRTVAIHGDTKLDNFLFSTQTGRVKALVDLDTIMPQTWLADWGDMVRSLVNVAGEKEADMARVQVDMEIFEALARGFLSTASEITGEEAALILDAPQIIAIELGVRFLADYLRGDSYFTPGPADPPDINKVRAMVQFTLFERMRDQQEAARRCISGMRA